MLFQTGIFERLAKTLTWVKVPFFKGRGGGEGVKLGGKRVKRLLCLRLGLASLGICHNKQSTQ